MNLADYVCKTLVDYQIRTVFGYPGAAILPLMDSIERHPELEWVLMRNESSAAFAASAQAKLTKRLSVCMATSGPGATNLITGLIDADLDRAPVLVITGLTSSWKHGLAYFQEIDQVGLLKMCCGLSVTCSHALQLPELLENAIGYAIKNNRPAHIGISHDIQLLELLTPLELKELHRPLEIMAPPEQAIEIVSQTMHEMSDIIIAVGVRAYSAGPSIELLAEKLQAPIVCSFAGKGIIRENHPNYFGVLGLFGTPANPEALNAIKKAKVVLAFGVDDLLYFLIEEGVNQTRSLIQCEPDISSVSYQFIQTRTLLGRLDKIAENLANKITPQSPDLLNFAREQRQILKKQESSHILSVKKNTVHQKIFFEKLNAFINRSDVIIGFDIGDSTLWAMEYLRLLHHQSVLVSNHFGAMGFCLPAIIAAKLEKPDHLVIGISGDGGLQMVLSEINTAVQLNLNIFIFVFDNNVLQRVVAQQSKVYGTELKNPDWVTLAQSCGATGICIDNTEQIEEQLKIVFSIQNGPVLIDVKCDPSVFARVV